MNLNLAVQIYLDPHAPADAKAQALAALKAANHYILTFSL